MSDNKSETFTRLATIIGFIVDAAQLIIWVLPVIMSLAVLLGLSANASSVNSPTLGISFGPVYQLTLLASGFLVYISFLRRQWLKSKATEDPLSETFAAFLFIDLPQFKRPLLLIPLLFFAVLFSVIVYSIDATILGFIVSMVVIIGLAVLSVIMETDEESWDANEELRNRWIRRINKELETSGRTDTESLLAIVGAASVKKVNWALEMYFLQYEEEKGLVLRGCEKTRSTENSPTTAITPETTYWSYELSIRSKE